MIGSMKPGIRQPGVESWLSYLPSVCLRGSYLISVTSSVKWKWENFISFFLHFSFLSSSLSSFSSSHSLPAFLLPA